jgi:predicted transcriptional regulator YdeE
MKYYFILPTSLKEIDKKDDNIDVCVETSDGKNYTFVIATEKNIIKHPGLRAIIVKKITYKTITKAIKRIMKLERRIIDYYGSNDDNQ